MKACNWAMIIVAILLGGACGNQETDNRHEPMGGNAPAGASGSSASSTSLSTSGTADGSTSGSASVSTSAGTDALRDQLTVVLAPLVQPPFGTAAAVTALHGELRVSVTLGTLWEGGPQAVEDTRFNVASVSKLFTAARVVGLAHQGDPGLDHPLGQHLPGVQLLGVDGGVPPEVVTIRHMLSHRSGVPHVPPDLSQHVGSNWTSPDLLQRITASWTIQLVVNPGTYRYSNLGYALLGAIIERKGNCTFATCMAGYLQDHLGMSQSTFWPATLEDNAAHGRVVEQGLVKFHPPAWYGSRYALPFSGLWTPMPDLAGFGRVLLAAAKDPASPLHAMTVGQGHGLGPIHSVRLGAPSLEHDGSGPGFYAALVVIPDKDMVLAIATNGGNELASESRTFAQIVSAAVDAIPEP